ncbi:tetratricopeptide repeat protein [Pyxidicoccus fallax]|uniref:tetratricopeptide repeat protein n=1 Tax=Pyxidicoccus fallax TaxID=394095 RepID=UPI001495037B|nr:tetratricopeptide repeat protein [Pyxidicoccus fallax]NPC80614.1 tetratricopeptide repeat protein [Pyxidicoccus fallax]
MMGQRSGGFTGAGSSGGGGASPILAHRRRTPLATRLKRAWRYVFTASGLPVLMAVSLALAFLGWMMEMSLPFLKPLPLALYGSMFWGTFFTLVRDTSRGEMELDTPEFIDFFRDGLLPGIRGLTATTLVFLPALLYVMLGYTGWVGLGFVLAGESRPPGLMADVVLWLLLLLGLVWLPFALLVTASGMPPTVILDVPRMVRMARNLGSDYLLTTGVLVLLGGVHLVTHVVALVLRAVDMFIVSRVLAEGVTLLAPFTAAHVLGLLMYVRGDSVGYGMDRDYLEPVLGDTKPRLAAPPMRDGELFPEAPEGATLVEMPDAARRTENEELTALASAVESRDVPQAMALYAALRGQPKVRVPPAHHLFIGQAAAVEGNFPLAVQALESAADVAPDDPTAPRALVLLARVLGEKMQEISRAEQVYRYVIHRYPDSSAARFARERVPPSAD